MTNDECVGSILILVTRHSDFVIYLAVRGENPLELRAGCDIQSPPSLFLSLRSLAFGKPLLMTETTDCLFSIV
jgi:hypothetical protein